MEAKIAQIDIQNISDVAASNIHTALTSEVLVKLQHSFVMITADIDVKYVNDTLSIYPGPSCSPSELLERASFIVNSEIDWDSPDVLTVV